MAGSLYVVYNMVLGMVVLTSIEEKITSAGAVVVYYWGLWPI